MITKCRFCEFTRESPLSKHILDILINEDLPTEDLVLWFQRLTKQHGTHDWNGVKVHMGRMHKAETYFGIWPTCEFSEGEQPLIDKVIDRFLEQDNFNESLVDLWF